MNRIFPVVIFLLFCSSCNLINDDSDEQIEIEIGFSHQIFQESVILKTYARSVETYPTPKRLDGAYSLAESSISHNFIQILDSELLVACNLCSSYPAFYEITDTLQFGHYNLMMNWEGISNSAEIIIDSKGITFSDTIMKNIRFLENP